MFKILLDVPAQKFLKNRHWYYITNYRSDWKAYRRSDSAWFEKNRGPAEKLFRIRAGKFRILYRVDYTDSLIVVIKYIQWIRVKFSEYSIRCRMITNSYSENFALVNFSSLNIQLVFICHPCQPLEIETLITM